MFYFAASPENSASKRAPNSFLPFAIKGWIVSAATEMESPSLGDAFSCIVEMLKPPSQLNRHMTKSKADDTAQSITTADCQLIDTADTTGTTVIGNHLNFKE